MRGVLGLVDTDTEGRLLELEGVCVVREYLVLRAALRALKVLRERMPAEKALGVLEGLLREAVEGAELDVDRYGIYLSDSAAYLALEAEPRLRLFGGQESQALTGQRATEN